MRAPSKRPKKGHPVDPEAWGRCCLQWQRITGRLGSFNPDKGNGKLITEKLRTVGPIVEQRLAAVADAREFGRGIGLTIWRFMEREKRGPDMLMWQEGGKLLAALDAAIEQADEDPPESDRVVDIREYMTPAERMIAAYDELQAQGRTMIGGIGG